MQTLKTILLLVSLLGYFSWASAADITGQVKGPDGAPFKGAFVQAQNTSTKITVSVLSDRQGQYHLEKLPAGGYEIRVRAVGYKVAPHDTIKLTDHQKVSVGISLEKDLVRWKDISIYEGEQLLPQAAGKEVLFDTCFACHGFQTRMASAFRDASGWRDRVNFMVTSMHYFIAGRGQFTDKDKEDVISYLSSTFAPNSRLAKSPSDVSRYEQVKPGPFSDDAMKIVYTEYELPGPNRMAWSAAPDKNGDFWIPYFGDANKIGKLDPKTATVQEFEVPNHGTAAIHSAVAAPDGAVWLAEQGPNKLGKWDPTTKEITEYQDAYAKGKEGLLSGGSKHTVRIAPTGEVWASGGPLSRFDPKTNMFKDFPEVPSCYGIAIGNDGSIWFAEFTPNGEIGSVNPQTLKVTKYAQPTAHSTPRRIQVDSDGIVWFAEYDGGKIGRFDPKTESFKEYSLPGAKPTPYALGIDKDHFIWYSSEYMDYVGRLDPKTGEVVQYPFPHSENSMREFFLDSQGHMWFGSPANNKVGYFYVTGDSNQ